MSTADVTAIAASVTAIAAVTATAAAIRLLLPAAMDCYCYRLNQTLCSVTLTWYLSLCFVEWLVKTLVMIHYTACSCYCCYTITILHYTTPRCYRRLTAMQADAICFPVLIRFFNKTPTDTNLTSRVRTQYEKQFAINYNVGFWFLSITVCWMEQTVELKFNC